jgi:hypothetical protein
VTAGDIRAVLSLDAEVVTRPSYGVPAPEPGRFDPAVIEGMKIEAGDVLGVMEDGSEILAPSGGTVVKVEAARDETIPAGISVVTLESHGFGLRAPVTGADRYRLAEITAETSARASIVEGPGNFACSVLGGPQNSTEGLEVLCAPPEDLRLFDGLRGILVIDLEHRADTLVLPLSAVAGSAESGAVTVIDESGKESVRKVVLGVSDGSRIEILKGLMEGETVASDSPEIWSGAKSKE